MIHELRIYECVPGRLPALNKRFETVTLKVWQRLGIRQGGSSAGPLPLRR
jgi:hypothetical protein